LLDQTIVMADSEITDAHPSRQSRLAEISKLNYNSGKVSNFLLRTLKDRYRCPYFRILVIGRANAGKTTILEKVCSVARGTISMIYDQNGEKLEPSKTHLIVEEYTIPSASWARSLGAGT